MAARVAATVTPMPPPSYGWPVMRAANSVLRSPAKTRWLCESTKPGMITRPPTSMLLSAAGTAAVEPIQAIMPSSTTRAALEWMPSRSAPVPSQVTSSPIPATAVLLIPPLADQEPP